jgi:hypothetical protein
MRFTASGILDWARRRGPWTLAVPFVGVGVALAVPVFDRDLYGALVATYLGAALGFFVALYVDPAPAVSGRGDPTHT